jgi:hypothetical protein
MPVKVPSMKGVVALFNASDDTIEMVQRLLSSSTRGQQLIWCHFADLRKGVVNFDKYMADHNPEVVIFDLSPPYDQNWTFFKTMRDSDAMKGRGVVLTTTNKDRLDEVLHEDSFALEVVGKADDLLAIDLAIQAETERATTFRREATALA